jgi:tetratricopeptide (TPR) repeat protein
MTKFKNLLSLEKIKAEKNTNKIVFILLSAFLLLLMPVLSKDAGISGDEYFHVDHAENVYNYYKSLGKDKTATYNSKTLHLYGQSLDNEVHLFNELFNVDDIYASRHFFNSIIGWILILFTGLTTVLLFGWRAGYIAMLFLFFSPRILGHSFNNLKDLPFAAACAFSIYFMIRHIKELPKQNYKTLLFIILGIAWAISLRIGGIILIPYLFVIYGLYYLTQNKFLSAQNLKEAFKNIRNLIIVSVVAYFLGLILWPYALQNPLSNPLSSLKNMTNYGLDINQLFEGLIYKSRELPWYYGIKYILITSPIVVFIGCLAFAVSLIKRKAGKTDYVIYFFLFFTFLFPLVYTIYQDSTLYGGWRHLLWIYSPLVILSAGGLDFYINNKSKYIKYGGLGIILLFLIHPVKYTVKNHPYEYSYFNQLVGGINGAYGEYEVDYYYHGLKEGVDWLIQNDLVNDSITIVTNHGRIVEHYLRNYPNIKVQYSMYYQKSGIDWDYGIWTNTHIDPHQLSMGYWPPKENSYTVYADSVPITAVTKRISYEDVKGYRSLRKNRLLEARNHFKNFLKVYPESEEVLEGVAITYLFEQNLDSALFYADKSLFYNPGHLSALVQKARIYNAKRQFNDALEAAEMVTEQNGAIAEAHLQKGIALKNLRKPNEAIQAFQRAIQEKNDNYQARLQIGEILVNYKNYKKALDVYTEIFTFRKYDISATINSAKCYHLMGNNNTALKLLNSLPNNVTNNLEERMVSCRIEIAQGRMNTAESLLTKTNNVNNNSELFTIRALYALRTNNIKQANNFLRRAVELNEDNQEAQELLKSIQTKTNNTAHQNNLPQKPQSQQSIMFQKQKPK